MKRRWLAAVAVAAVAVAIIAYKELVAPGGAPSGSRAAASTAAGTPPSASTVASGSPTTVLLFADPDEAESACGCGQIIRLVRGAAARGVSVRETAPGSDPALEREHRVTVAPTVLLLGPDGRATARYEGEASETVEAIRTGLERLAGAPR